MSLLSNYAQHHPVTRYCGVYCINLNSDSTYFLKSGYFWVSGMYKWSGDTIFFKENPVYDTIIINTPDSTRFVFKLSADTISSVAEVIKTHRAVFGFDKENGTFNVVYPPNESTQNEMRSFQVFETFPSYLIKKRNKLGFYNSKNIFVVVGKKLKFR